MTILSGPSAAIEAEWGLWGKEAHDPDYRLLRCSAGTFTAGALIHAIVRYSPGNLEVRELPQVTVGWLRHPRTGLPTHLSLGIHETAAGDDPRSGHARSQLDAAGREIVYVRYFCVRYDDLAEQRIGYRQLYHGFRRRAIPARGQDPAVANLVASEDPPPSARELQFAGQVSAQLLTTRPVCILGAYGIALERRLRFIDLVMSGLPYGARSQLSAATWVNTNSADRKFRLFFASAPRDDPGARPGRKPVAVEWDRVETAGSDDPEAIRYLAWKDLEGRRAPGVLARDRKPVDLKDKAAIREMLSRLERGNADRLTWPGPAPMPRA